FKRTQTFDEQDYDILVDLLANFGSIHTTPHVLTEVSNLSRSLPIRKIEDFAPSFIQSIHNLPEHHAVATEVVLHNTFPRFGLSDAYLAVLASEYLLLTDDLRLSNWIAANGVEVINFNHLRRYTRP